MILLLWCVFVACLIFNGIEHILFDLEFGLKFCIFIYQIIDFALWSFQNYVEIVYIPSAPKKELALFLKKVARVVPGLYVVDVDVPLDTLCIDDEKLEQIALGRELHISLGRSVPIRLHQIDTVVTMLRQKLQLQRRSDFCAL